MNIKFRKFQEGGPMPAPAPAEGGAGDPVQELAMMAQQALEAQDCQAAMQVCDGLLQLISGGAQAEAPAGPEAGAPAPEAAPEGGEPVYRMGGRLVKRNRR